MANVTYTVKKGDSLWAIAASQLGNGSRYPEIAKLNNIDPPYLIFVGQVLIISGTAATVKKNVTSKVTIKHFGLQSNSARNIFVTWNWDRDNTENYSVKWEYDTGDDVWFVGSESTVTAKQSTYSAPENALRVRVRIKPISKKYKKNNTETSYWTASWSTAKVYDFSDSPPKKPNTPSIEIKDLKLTIKLENLDLNAKSIQFKIVRDDATVYKNVTVDINTVTNSVTYSCTVAAGSEYKVACRSVRGKLYSDWSEFTGAEGTQPAAPASIKTCKAKSEKSVYLEWDAVKTAETYDIEYTTKLEYFDGSDATTTISSIKLTHHELTGLEIGEEYFFRVRAVNADGESAWTEVRSVAVGKKPSAPTTWSSTTTAITSEPLNLYWIHNSEDGSSQTYAELELIVDGEGVVHTIKNSEEEDEKDKTSVYPVDTSVYTEGSKIQWRVRTAGVTKQYGEWSIQRTIDIYAPPTLELEVKDINGNSIDSLEAFPFYISALAGPNTQVPISYSLVITTNEAYESVDDIGNVKMVSVGEAVYSKQFDVSTALLVEMSAQNVDLENNIPYTITCSVTMNSGLTTESIHQFNVMWTDMEYEPNAVIGIDSDTISAIINPYCRDENDNLIENVTLSVYRREFDGGFTEIIKNIANSDSTFVTDPHPSLDYARYRIVATTTDTGAVSYCDLPGYPVGEKAVIIQWDEEWTAFDTTNEDELANPPWSGSMLRLPYNIDVSDSFDMDVTMANYIGRKRPVSYYGTQLGESSTWNVSIDKKDEETLYALRRLAIWTGDVYVREPSGTGYWANLKVSFGQKHKELAIPVTLNITRVEGGM